MNWNLDDICPKDKFDDLAKEIETNSEDLEKWWPKMEAEIDENQFREFIEFDEQLGEKISRLTALPELMLALNQKDSEARLMKNKAQEIWLKLSQKSRKFDHWLKGLEVEGKKRLDDKNAKRLAASVPDLEYSLHYGRMAAKHTLREFEEEIVENKDINGQSVIADLRELIETEMVYKIGKRKIKTQAELLKLVHDTNPKKRKDAYTALLTEQKKHLDKLDIIFQSVVRDWEFETKIRGYESPITMRNFANHVSDKAIETLLEVCQEKRNIFWRYFNYKAKIMGKKKLSRYDLYAPRQKTKTKQYSLEESKKIVLAAYEQFDPKMAILAKKVFEEQHIDTEPRVNKTSGAFCATVGPTITPYVMLNHTGSLRDVATMAHELGHAIHSLMANKHQPSSQQANLPLSETASTLGELILFEKMLVEERDKAVKKQMLWEKIADSYATILRQNYFVKFEIEVYRLISQGATAKEISELYYKNLKEQFGKSVEVAPIFKYEWLYISHIFESPFYCYAYNFGELLSLSLFGQYKQKGKEFVRKIEKVLETGGAKDPTKILAEIGVEIESKEFWRAGMRIIEGWQNELESV